MEPTERQLDRVARRLDGEDIVLDESEESIADEIRRDERRLWSALDVDVPAGAIARVQSQVTAELDRRRGRALRFAIAGGAAGALAAAAAIVLMLSIAGTQRPTDVSPRPAVTVTETEPVPLEVLLAANAQSVGPFEVDLLESEVGTLRMDLVSADVKGLAMDAEMDQLQQQMEEFWLYDTVLEPLDM